MPLLNNSNKKIILTTPLGAIKRLTEAQEKALNKLGLKNVEDLLYYFPTRYGNIAESTYIKNITPGETYTLFGHIEKLNTKKTYTTKTPLSEAVLKDMTGSIHLTWFHQAYIAKMLKAGDAVKVTGTVTKYKDTLSITNPEIEKTSIMPIDLHTSLFSNEEDQHNYGYPVYPETRGLSSKWILHTIMRIFKSTLLDDITDPIPENIRTKYKLPAIKTAFIWAHTPAKKEHAEAARKRFAFEEIFLIQLSRAIDKKKFSEEQSYTVHVDEKDIADFVSRFPFKPTNAQHNAINTILLDLTKPHPMARLLEGDVGSGKTAVAATIAYAIIKNRPFNKEKQKLQTYGSLQTAYMAPTEILATQHFESFIKYFTHTGISIGLITGSGCRKFPTKVASSREPWTNISRTQLLKWVANGEIPIVIGTHALISKSVKFKHLALAIVDEQHRFGLKQRKSLAEKTSDGAHVAPHFLSMTATPIPRTLALTLYGDLDLSLLDSMPIGRKPAQTTIISTEKREQMYKDIRIQLQEGRQLYVICPRISDPDPDLEIKMQLRSVTKEAENMQKNIFPEYNVGILHSKMTPAKKDSVMNEFANGKIHILVATSVVEVGVNVPNATVMVIEGTERFGLAQLHQLRGRILRSNHQPYCYLVPDTKSVKTADRLKALITAKNGFELSELDLTLRGAGELSGFKQWGVSDIGMEAIKNIKMVEAARTEAKSIVEIDVTLQNYPALARKISEKNFETHFE
ncbi:MAG: ATP-dependent DNA helicase RecG [Minisyncoccia bacterium]